MLAVLGSSLDRSATALVEAWSTAGAMLLSAEDLSRAGWAFRVAAPGAGAAVIGGERVRVSQIRAVVTRRPAVLAEELTAIEPADRAYLAAEMNAFLVAWLSALPCPVLNRPTPRSLNGPAWTALHWAAAAAEVGVHWVAYPAAPTQEVDVCGAAGLEARSSGENDAARALAQRAGVELLGVRFCTAGACAATAIPPLDTHDIRAAVLDHLGAA